MELTVIQQFPLGDEPTHIEVAAFSSSGEVTESVIVPVGEPAHLNDDSPDLIRWRYIWGGERGIRGAWNGEETPVWQTPAGA
jgi:hypothetical protein